MTHTPLIKWVKLTLHQGLIVYCRGLGAVLEGGSEKGGFQKVLRRQKHDFL